MARRGGKLVAAGTAYLMTPKAFGPGELVFDWKVPAKSAMPECVVSMGGQMVTVTLPKWRPAGSWHRQTIKAESVASPAPIQFVPSDGLEIMNVYFRELNPSR
jgi:hypothetical protein